MYIQNPYYGFLIFFLLAVIVNLSLFGISFLFSSSNPDKEKLSAYECGFNPFDDARQKFDIRFYLVAILFIIFDLEVVFLYPWSMVLYSLNFFGFFVMLVFLFILTVGFAYEWVSGALEWE